MTKDFYKVHVAFRTGIKYLVAHLEKISSSINDSSLHNLIKRRDTDWATDLTANRMGNLETINTQALPL